MSAPVPISCLPAGHSTVTLLLDAESLVLKLVTRCRPGTAAEAMLASAPPSTTKSATRVAARSASRLSGRCGRTGVGGCTWVRSLIDTRTPAHVDPTRRLPRCLQDSTIRAGLRARLRRRLTCSSVSTHSDDGDGDRRQEL